MPSTRRNRSRKGLSRKNRSTRRRKQMGGAFEEGFKQGGESGFVVSPNARQAIANNRARKQEIVRKVMMQRQQEEMNARRGQPSGETCGWTGGCKTPGTSCKEKICKWD